ncbi:hypothetical protein ACFOHS_19845 [Jhaorihella thermophila]
MIAGVSACQSTGMPVSEAPAPENATVSLTTTQRLQVPTLMPRQPAQEPVDVIELRDRYLAANPDKAWLELDGFSFRGFRLAKDGTAYFDGGRSKRDLSYEMSYSPMSGQFPA